ncbi:MAG: HAD-IB family hydrolase [Candidatus Harrisonbacteria bacterium CG10_big_fil_rev_8_21_14_0_10_38_8]|uniref:phosphoserine phosphatase n=1 Tax=Candidatus Harrisonbacteria bacterium CG10_big_fil_rev_8_21_14_0_10_38_8 TaxID=1974582 RepID=A0A2M6WKH4_9BACT|nr:MAG: HAD-IB family hydrolase [Candidatus Harrisonbacteria bacterium CG10_big_fil_rev_8_21_14_0_10_38_8]
MKKKLAVFDIDGTIFRNSLLAELHWKLVRRGVIDREDVKTLDKFYWSWVTRKGEYDDYISEVIDNFNTYIAGVSQEVINSAVKKVIEVQSDIVYRYTRDLIKSLRKEYILIAISGSPEVIVKEFSFMWDFDMYKGTDYEVVNEKYTGTILSLPVSDKKKALEEIVEENGYSLKDSIAVGDTESDIGMLSIVTNPICFNPTNNLYLQAKKNNWSVVVERKNVIYKL